MQNKKMITTIAVVIVVGAGAFFGGTVYEKDKLSSQGLLRNASAQSANGGQRGQGGAGGGAGFARGGGAGGGNNSGNFVAGQITAKNDTSITVQGRDGSSKIVFFSGSTSIGKSAQGTSGDLSSGEQVVVTGQANSDGTVAAQNIQIRPADQQPPQPQQ